MKSQRRLALERKGSVNRGQTGVRIGNNFIAFPTADSKKAAIAESTKRVEELTALLQSLESGDEAALPLCAPEQTKLEVGAIGTYKVGTAIDIVDNKQVIVAIPRFTAPQTVVRGGALATSSPRRLEDIVVWLKGMPTAGMVTDGRVDMTTTVLHVTGTTTYDMEDEQNTVFVLEPFDLEPAKAAWKELHSRPVAKTTKPSPRTWTSADGKFTFEATFVGQTGGIVKLRKADGKVVELPAEKLSDADRAWISE